jgi:hypothetical protein
VSPEQELKAFKKVYLAAGETKTTTLDLDESAFSYYNPAQTAWISESGEFKLRLGRSSEDIRLTTSFVFVNPLDTPYLVKSTAFHVGLSIAQLLGNPECNAILKTHLGDIVLAPTMLFAMAKPLEVFANENPHLVHSRMLGKINEALANLTSS